MATKLLAVTDEEERLLRDLLRIVRSGRFNTPLRSQFPEVEEIRGSDTVICKPQETSGIPGKGSVGSGSSTAFTNKELDQPGSADCDVFRIDTDGELVDADWDITVYNLSENDISQDWIQATLTRYGNWVAVPPNARFRCRTTTDHAVNTTAQVDVYINGTASGWEIPALNEFADISDLEFCYVEYLDGQWRIYAANPCA